MSCGRPSRYLAVLGGISLFLTVTVLVGRRTEGEEVLAPPSTPPSNPAVGDTAHLMDCRMAHLKLREMPGYQMKWWAFSHWPVPTESRSTVTGVRYLWVRERDGLQIDMDVAVFDSPQEARAAAELRVDELGLAPQPRTKEKVGQGLARFGAASLDGRPLGERTWSRQPNPKVAQQAVYNGRMSVLTSAYHGESVDIAEVMRELRKVAERPPKPERPRKPESPDRDAKKN